MAGSNKTETAMWDALHGLDDDLLDPALPQGRVDEELQLAGVDPGALAERGIAFVAALATEERLAWQARAAAQKAELGARAAKARGNVPRSWDRNAILARLEQLRSVDGKLGTAISMAARKRRPEESSDEELRTLLEEMEALRAIEGDGD
jgi:hypothetical protein